MESPKFNSFAITKVVYKVVNKQDIDAFVLVPKTISIGKSPVIVKFHGGGHVTGASLYPDWFSQWSIDFAILHSAIIVAADYRLLPESNGQDMLSDIHDFWLWLSENLQSSLDTAHSGLEADLSKIIAYGESAGAHLALLSGLHLAPKNAIRTVIAAYPAVEPRTSKPDKPLMGAGTIAPSILEDYLASLEPGKIVTSAIPPARVQIWLAITQQNRKGEFIGSDEGFWPMKVLEESAAKDKLPYTLILHGEDDSVVPIEGSRKFAKIAEEKFGEEWGLLVTQAGEHGFDVDVPLETGWLKDALSGVIEKWLS